MEGLLLVACRLMESSPPGMLPVTKVKGRKHGESCVRFGLEVILFPLTFYWPVNERQVKASQMAMPNFRWAEKHNLIIFLEGGESEIFDKQP